MEVDKLEISYEFNRELWAKGIINDISYVLFVLKLSKFGGRFNVENFIANNCIIKEELSEEQLRDGWKAKILNFKTVLAAIVALEEKNFITPDIDINIELINHLF